MPCVHPLKAWKLHGYVLNGKSILFNEPHNVPAHIRVEPIQIPCGQCIACRRKYAFDWAMRMEAEAQLHDSSYFVTLTYDEEHLPRLENGLSTLVYKDLQDFLKRLRKRVGNHAFRYYACGEYGDKSQRAHFHVVFFGLQLADKRVVSTGKCGSRIYRSKMLDDAWKNGLVGITDVAFEVFAYVSGYMLKKQKGARADDYYQGRAPEKSLMSRRPGIAHDWYVRYSSDVYPRDHLINRGREVKPPKYYDKLLMSENLDKYLKVKEKRRENLVENSDYSLMAREKILLSQMRQKTKGTI